MISELELREAAADLRKKAAQAEAQGYFDLNTLEAAERLERYADQIKAEREELQRVSATLRYWGQKC